MLLSANGIEATSETGLHEQGGKLDPSGARKRLPCCVFLHLVLLQINETRHNASIGKVNRSDLRDRATRTGGNMS